MNVPSLVDQELRQRAHGAFRRGRLREALGALALALPLVAASLLLSEAPARAAGFAALLVAASALFAFWGRDAGRVVLPGLILGSLPLVCALLAPHLGHVCTGTGCVSLCLPLCTSGGLTAGVLLARYANAQPQPARAWLFGATITLATGLMGCACAGLPSALGMLGGVLLPQLGARLSRLTRRQAR